MKTGVFLFGGVEMNDAGAGLPLATDRRYSSAEAWRATEQLLEIGVEADRLGFDSYWLTEHHFQHEGYEVIPNGLLFGSVLAERTQQIRIGTMFNVVGQWHPLRLAEDFSAMHNISGGRGILGIGRGTVPREAESLGTKIGSFDNPEAMSADEFNRKQFDEAVEVVRLALDNETFSYHGSVYEFPPAGIPDRGGFVETLSLIPRPIYPYEIWQAVTSPPTLEAVPKKGYGGVFWLKNYRVLAEWWKRFGDLWQNANGVELQPGQHRKLVVSVCIEDSYEAAAASVRPGHDEFWKFLGPYGWSRGYVGEDNEPFAAGLIPTLEQSIDNRTWLIGTADDVLESIEAYREELGGLENLVIFPNMPGDNYSKTTEQIQRFAEGILPNL